MRCSDEGGGSCPPGHRGDLRHGHAYRQIAVGQTIVLQRRTVGMTYSADDNGWRFTKPPTFHSANRKTGAQSASCSGSAGRRWRNSRPLASTRLCVARTRSGVFLEYWRRRPDLNRGWRFCRLTAVPMLLASLTFWSRVLAGFSRCSGVTGPNLAPRSCRSTLRPRPRSRRPSRCPSRARRHRSPVVETEAVPGGAALVKRRYSSRRKTTTSAFSRRSRRPTRRSATETGARASLRHRCRSNCGTLRGLRSRGNAVSRI